jgi:hypothetical protein
LGLEVLVEVAGADAEVLTDADCGEGTGADQAVDRHGRHAHRIRDLAYREQFVLAFTHGRHPLGPVGSMFDPTSGTTIDNNPIAL